MISERASKYLSTLERRPAVRDPRILEDAFRAAGIRVLEAVIDFQINFGGYVQRHGLNQFVWGILHAQPDPYSFFEPNRLFVENDDEEPGNVFVTCADCHGSDHWFLDARGALYWCFAPPLSASFAIKIERDAICWELGNAIVRRIEATIPSIEFIERLIPRIEEGRVHVASDAYETIYLHGGLYAAVKGDRIKAFLVEERGRSLLQGLPVSVKG